MKIKKAIILAAGLGTRFLPATKSQPKEMLPIVDKPCIQYLVEEAVASGIEQIIIVTGRRKRSIEDHFDVSFELNEYLKSKGKIKFLNQVKKIEQMAKFIYVRQPYPKGDGHAILCAAELVEDEPFAVLFGDDIYDSETPALKQLIQQYKKTKSPVIALHKIPKKDSDKHGIVKTKKSSNNKKFKNLQESKFQTESTDNELLHEISELVEKPKPEKAPSNLGICGKYIITPELLETLKNSQSHTKDKELRLIDGMKNFVKKSPIYGYEIKGKRFDTGDKLGYLKATVHFALKHKTLNKEFKKHLRTLDL